MSVSLSEVSDASPGADPWFEKGSFRGEYGERGARAYNRNLAALPPAGPEQSPWLWGQGAKLKAFSLCATKRETTRMWANAQPDGRPAEHNWRRLFNTAKFGWRPLLDAVQ